MAVVAMMSSTHDQYLKTIWKSEIHHKSCIPFPTFLFSRLRETVPNTQETDNDQCFSCRHSVADRLFRAQILARPPTVCTSTLPWDDYPEWAMPQHSYTNNIRIAALAST